MSISIESTATDYGGVTLVTALVRNDDEADRRVRVTNELNGVVRPPTRDGVAVEGWDAEGFEGVVRGRGTLALGYACGGAPADDPCRVAWTERTESDRRGSATVADALRDLDDPRPPAASGPSEVPEESVPPAVAAWLDGVADRVSEGTASEADRRALESLDEHLRTLAGGA
ncbi:hypothetical protein J2752_001089 [Halarchaeum rubridurum]|uniref:Uncharacterized protein n=1 Tax=Halarchaeum rubridurum TaxID=489911 RepID=A0A830FXX8_9EURY|nr:hypothetical protein [Halarchaeum rubridurum]MBP1954208.1 hypothetical protein [Halarchaeum rubridurum]GGM58167.1 hypothetical protein GCM10009017_05420 [Halarchaeum rubridurum]